ncbi:ATP-binding protein [Streptomyces filipinensis]|uniref:ATP-binding protein n=1 Tax=Streptomyces filipinensis TaxID=66887 RepID=UPI0036F034E0
MDCSACMPRRPWEVPFLAEPEEVAALRRLLLTHLALWGLPELTDAAQLCVSELVSNVIRHVGRGTPTTLAVSMSGANLRLEVHDPNTRALPMLLEAADCAESGRGMALVAAASDRWGVQLLTDRKVTWVELATDLCGPNGHGQIVHVSRAEDPLVDILHRLRTHGHDVGETLDRTQAQFEADADAAGTAGTGAGA